MAKREVTTRRKASESATADADAALEREVAELSYEDALAQLERIIESVEHGDAGLEEALEAYRRGRALLRRCQTVLDRAEQEIERLSLSDAERRAAEGDGDNEEEGDS
jgi:exodeoxyribonuclease VII small subunit